MSNESKKKQGLPGIKHAPQGGPPGRMNTPSKPPDPVPDCPSGPEVRDPPPEGTPD